MKTLDIPPRQARAIWFAAQKLDTRAPFGSGPDAARAAIEHLGYVQIDTINVVERCHHHILFSRIPDYRRSDLAHLQTVEKSVFEYWTHALAYVPTRDLPFFLGTMRAYAQSPGNWFGSVSDADMRRVKRMIATQGPLSIRDIDDDVLVEKDHPWASRKPSKRALELGFFTGQFTIAEREGIVKSYDLMERHFAWERRPRPATDRQIIAYKLERALRSQGLVSIESICHLDNPSKPAVRALIEAQVRKRRLVSVHLDGNSKAPYFVPPELLEISTEVDPTLCHILSPFDPLIIQRKRTAQIFGYDHVFEAYVPKDKRQFGYFTLPVLVGDDIVAVLDLKADRAEGRLLIQAWHWVGRGNPADHKSIIETELDRFARFQFPQ